MPNTLTPDEQAELDNWFTYHPPTPETKAIYDHVRSSSRALVEYLLLNVPRSADRTAAIRSIRRTVMDINLAVACNR